MKLYRSSGLLLHITSLPSPYGIGDMGKDAYQFIDFLHQSGYRYWQLLPINPTEASFNHSPYSSYAAFAGNPLLISPEMLQKAGFLSRQDLASPPSFNDQKVDFDRVRKYKEDLLNQSYKQFLKKEKQHSNPFNRFCEENLAWLEDYAVYLALKGKYQCSWVEWPKPARDRDPKMMAELKTALAEEIKKEKFIQYLFFSQWEKLVDYSHQKEIAFIGDIPFYINHDSVDCWAHSVYFKLDKNKKPTKISGVPPDYFSKTGQLWGTPVFDWEALKKNRFDWWIARLKQNLRLYDMVRLDHFRAFAAYWEVPAGDETAIDGQWTLCPGKDFFRMVQEEFPDMPFIAEDLGLLDQPVFDLLEEFNFPGMKVLQFAFDENIGQNPYILHHHSKNHVVFTGTHDNNTSLGWFNSLKKEEIQRISDYVGIKATKNNIHQIMHRLALMSVSDLAIVPMQDILGLDEKAVMNKPATSQGNWTWRLAPNQLPINQRNELKKMNRLYGRWKEKEKEAD